MSENVLVIEYEPKYIEKVRNALAGHPFETFFAHDGDEALRALDSKKPALIILSSMVPKANTTDLIHAARQRADLRSTPILLTVSGYTGSNPKGDAVRFGASDLLPKPYSEADLLQKVHQLVPAGPKLTSDQIFGDILEEKTAPSATKKTMNPNDDVDKLLADTLSGVMTQKKKDVPAAKPKAPASSADLDKLLSDLTMTSRPRTASGVTPVPRPPAPAESPAANIPISVPVIPKAAPAPPPVEEPEPADGTRFGQYVLLEKIATGGMAEVWKARMRGVEGFQKIVAIKKILPHLSDNQDFVDMFIDEAKLAAQLNHSNIIHIYDLGKIQSSYYIAMEYIDGCDLKTILKQAEERAQPLTLELALFIAAKIAAALDYAHRKRDFENKDLGLVHRDVSPQNVLISKEGDIKLCDFGIAKAASKASHTQAGALKGKLQYMSPEQAWGKTIDKRSDVFALATVLFEMLTGRQLFTGENEISILEQVREARVDPPSKYNDEVTPEIDAIVKKALQKEPADRYQTAGEMARELDAILYAMKPTPTSADLAIYMHRLETTPAVAPQMPEEVTAAAPAPAAAPSAPAPVTPPPREVAAQTPPGVIMPSWEGREEKKKSSVVPMSVAAVVVLAALGGGGYFFYTTRHPAPAAPAKQAEVKAQVIPAPAVAQPTAATAAVPANQTVATQTTPAQPVIDQAAVDAEVAKRIAAERTKLEDQMRARQAAQQPAAAPQLPPPILTRRTVEPQPPAQQPATQPVTTSVAPPLTQTVAAQTPPPPQPAEPPKAKVGDLVAAGSEDVVARMIRRGDVPYPPMARVERIGGTVLISALISETGRVLQVKVIRGINRPVGLNEAAEEIVRRSTFSPPMKDGVRVKAWTTVPVDFKL